MKKFLLFTTIVSIILGFVWTKTLFFSSRTGLSGSYSVYYVNRKKNTYCGRGEIKNINKTSFVMSDVYGLYSAHGYFLLKKIGSEEFVEIRKHKMDGYYVYTIGDKSRKFSLLVKGKNHQDFSGINKATADECKSFAEKQ